jgi:hypothetical protein
MVCWKYALAMQLCTGRLNDKKLVSEFANATCHSGKYSKNWPNGPVARKQSNKSLKAIIQKQDGANNYQTRSFK